MRKRTKMILSFLLSGCFLIGGCSKGAGDDSGKYSGVSESAGGAASESAGGQADGLTLSSVYNGAELDLLDEAVREYLCLTDEDSQAAFLAAHVGDNYDYQSCTLRWKSNGSKKYTLWVADNEGFENALQITTNRIQAQIGLLQPGKTYYWKVEGDGGVESAVDTFSTKDAPCRVLSLDGAHNVRDLGGWTTESGKKVNYGLLYRGGKLNAINAGDTTLSERGVSDMRDILGIKTEIDLRSSADNGGQTESFLGSDILYVASSLPQYSQIVPSFKNYKGAAPAALKKIFDALSDRTNYPVYFHCNAGADRTGTLAFLINGFLGVPYGDLTRDFELTSFSLYGKRWRSDISEGKFVSGGVMQDNADNFVAWGQLYELIMNDYAGEGGTLSSAIENYLVSVVGCTGEQLQSIKEIMLS